MRTIEVYTRVLVRPHLISYFRVPLPPFGTEGSQLEPSSSPSWSRQDYLKILDASILESEISFVEDAKNGIKRDFDKKVNTFPEI